MFSSMKMEEYVESGRSENFRVTLVDMNIVLGFPETRFTHVCFNPFLSNISF